MRKTNEFWYTFLTLQIAAMFLIEFDFYYQVATSIFLYQATCFFFSVGKSLSIRYLIGFMYSLNYLFGPVLMYMWLNPFIEIQYTLKGNPDVYFGYVIPAMICILGGLHMFKKKGDEELDIEKIRTTIALYPNIPLYMIIFGTFVGFVTPLVPDEFVLVMNGLSQLKFVGLFLHILTAKRYNYVYFIVTYGLLMLQSLLTSMFNDFLNLLFFLGIILALRIRPSSTLKVVALGVGVAIVFIIQIIKFPIRNLVTEQGSAAEISQLDFIIDESIERSEGVGFESNIGNVVSRASQGWITSNVLTYYYEEHGFQFMEGAHAWILLKSSVLPRILAPDKYLVGDRDLFNSYTGHFLREGTSMALGIISDSFIDFGNNGLIVCFIWGLIFSLTIRLYNRFDKKYPLAKILSPLCFFYAIRPDTDTHSALGSIIKVTLVLWLIMLWFSRYYFSESPMKYIQKKLARTQVN